VIDLDPAVAVMARAFQNDPLWHFLIRDPERRRDSLFPFFRAVLSLGIESQRAYGIGSSLEGVAVWIFPGQAPVRLSLSVIGRFLRLSFSPFLFSVFKARNIFSHFQILQQHYALEPHYYLQTIGVIPEAQGKGLASRLVRPFLEQADKLQCGTYTETMTPSNVGLYEHYGFRCVEEYQVPRAELKIWALYRPAPSQVTVTI
jgi:ribosomal protein S18 acetylase RimI-like enzyme